MWTWVSFQRGSAARNSDVTEQEWTHRFLGAALAGAAEDDESTRRLIALPAGRELPPAEPTTKEVRAWARENGIEVPDRGRLRPEVWDAFARAAPHR